MREFDYYSALQDFRRARYRADLRRIVDALKEQPVNILAYDEVYAHVQTLNSPPRRTQKVPIDAIIGKVSRDKEFHERFFPAPRHTIRNLLKETVSHPAPPEKLEAIELYQIGESYVVSDGNARHSMAIQAGAQLIEAFITSIPGDAALSQNVDFNAVILKAECRAFLMRTHLDELRDWREGELTLPGKHHILEEQIDVCRRLLSDDQQGELSDEKLLLFWYDTLYLPTKNLIETLEVLHDFPERTAGDLYVWMCEHRKLLRRIGSLGKLPCAAERRRSVQHSADMSIKEPDSREDFLNFLEKTQLHTLRPDAHIPVIAPEHYHILLDHIDVHRYFMGVEKRREIPYHEAVTHWYDIVYDPIAQAVRQQALLEYFPAYSIGDLYLWISAYQIISRRDDVSRAEEVLSDTLAALPDFAEEMLDTIVISIEYIDFLLHTQLKKLRPEADLSINIPGKYRSLEEHINVHRHFMGIEQQREIPYHDAVGHWYDHVYLPVLQEISKQGILRAFPDLRAASLYLWVCEHRSKLEQQLEGSVDIATAATDLVTQFGSKKSSPLVHRQQLKSEANSKDSSGHIASFSQEKRREYALRRRESLFAEILVLVDAHQSGKIALEQALKIAQREESRLTGLHLLSYEHQLHTDGSFKLRSYFEQRCHAVGVEGSFHADAGRLREKIDTYCRLCDLFVYSAKSNAALMQPLPDKKTSSRTVQFLCASPPSSLQRALLLYDNTPTDNEALFAGVYLASRWGVALTILTSGIDAAGRDFVKEYLSAHGLDGGLLQQRGPLMESLGEVMHERDCDFIIAGSREMLLGKHGVTGLQYPLLLCRQETGVRRPDRFLKPVRSKNS